MLPSIIVIGAQKCGTTTLHQQLLETLNLNGIHAAGCEPTSNSAARGLCREVGKEANFFTEFRSASMQHEQRTADFERRTPQERQKQLRDLRDYSRLFQRCDSSDDKTISIDSSPNYMQSERMPRRLAELYGRARMERTVIVSLLCNPVQRAQSQFYFYRNKYNMEGQSWGLFATRNLSAATPQTWHGNFSDFLQEQALLNSSNGQVSHYVKGGSYAHALEAAVQAGPRKVLVVDSQSYFANSEVGGFS